jgi:O-antigen ligase
MTAAAPPSGRRLQCVEKSALALILTFLLLSRSPDALRSRLPLSLPLYLALWSCLVLSWWRRRRAPVAALGAQQLWDASLVLCGLWMAVSTLRVGTAPPEFWIWQSGLLLAIYGRRSYGSFYHYGFLLAFASLVLFSQDVICLIQYGLLLKPSGGQSPLAAVVGITDRPWAFNVGGNGVRIVRTLGSLPHPNVLGALIVVLLPFVFAGSQAARERGRSPTTWCLSGLLLLSLVILIRNLSRLSLLAGALGVALMSLQEVTGFCRQGAEKRSLASAGRGVLPLALLATVLASCLVFDSATGGAFSRIVRAKVADSWSTVRVRSGLLDASLTAVSERPLLGYGFGGYRTALPEVETIAEQVSEAAARKYRGATGKRLEPHNLYLAIAIDGGIPALAFFLLPLFGTSGIVLRRIRDLDREEASIAVGVLSYLTMSFGYIITYEAELWPLFLFLLGALMADATRNRRHDGERGRAVP